MRRKGITHCDLPEELNHRFQDGDELWFWHTQEELGFIAGTDTSLSLSLKSDKVIFQSGCQTGFSKRDDTALGHQS